ncbi:Ribonuclease P protein subunit p20 [Mycena kentingensis (nom. inval.)]|nr:Ribonuclease P protein subunit p20 [Mycena kentingensis (nom. inval.)]
MSFFTFHIWMFCSAAAGDVSDGEEEGGGRTIGLAHGDEKVNPRKRVRPDDQPGTDGPRRQITRLAPPRPFPTVPLGVSASGPRSAHIEGKNRICITRKTPLAAYLRRCKKVILEDGYKTLHLSAMGAAIPHLVQLSVSLPPILPFSADEISTEITTGTVEVQDEIVPDDEDEDIEYRTRGKSTLMIVLKIGDGGEDPPDRVKRAKPRPANPAKSMPIVAPPKTAGGPRRVVLAEPDQDDMEI